MDSLAGCRTERARMFAGYDGLACVMAALRRTLRLPADATEATLVADACRDSAIDVAALTRACDALEGGSATDRTRAAGLRAWIANAEKRIAGFDAYAGHLLTQSDE